MACIKNAVIVGGGIGGMVAAIALQRQGIDVHVVEAARREDQLGTGINLQNNALRALEQLGLLQECVAEGFGWETITNRDKDGNVINSFGLPWAKHPGRPGALGIMRTTFADILSRNALAAGVRISYQTKIVRLAQDGDGVEVELSNGMTEDTDLLVAADGVYSQIRGMVFGEEHQPFYAGQGVWRYTVPRPKSLDGFTMFRTAEGNSVGFLPLSEETAYYFYLETSIEPLRVERDKLAGELVSRLAPFDATEVRDAVGRMKDGWHISYRSFDILLMPAPWHRGRVVLLGDAAHSLTPQLTSGGGMAIEDAVVLAEELETHAALDAALAAYSERRERRVTLIYENSYRICELEKQKSASGAEATQLMIDSFTFLDSPY
ncbi:FAD-dependent monooxygenase [Sphingopyxis sp. GC21]|uniref:FAD-dependent monooxygenase n=1 Tax=Sphingopyxis sp. GC21 TaxID=2933562 RepID=UPI0021E49D9B|nr:FAD-dependent monooxygenase [Sphingopyxis sp. GC21]